MKKLSVITVLCLCIFIAGCKSKEPTKSTKHTPDEINSAKSSSVGINHKETAKDVIIERGFSAENKNNRMNILSATLNKDILKLIINYSGGCKEHDFNLYSTGLYAKSLPPQIQLHLIDSQDQDACRQLITDTLNFKLTNIKIPNTYKIIITVNEYEEKIEYVY